MSSILRRIVSLTLATCACAVPAGVAEGGGGCNCNGGAVAGPLVPHASPFVAPAPLGPVPSPIHQSRPIATRPPAAPINWTPNFPPGTLGRTYARRSRPVPLDEHPRTGMVEVRADRDAEVEADRMESYFGEDGLWHLKTEKPLTPGIPHIVRIRVKHFVDGVAVKDVRVIRLVLGRVVSVDI